MSESLPAAAASKALTGVMAAGVLVGALLWMDRGSPERGNRLYRRGEVTSALELYRAAASAPDRSGADSYNLGTALLEIDADEAEGHLSLAVQGGDAAAAQRGHYNLGYRYLTALDPSVEPEEAMPLLASAVSSNRAALRLDPKDENARWNLGLAQHLLDSLAALTGEDEESASEQRTGRRRDEQATATSTTAHATPVAEPQDPERAERATDSERSPSEAMARESNPESADGRAADDVSGPDPGTTREGGLTSERRAPSRGSREAGAGQDVGPVTVAAAMEVVQDLSDDPEQLIRGLLWSHRPSVSWWDGQAFPGGDR